MVDISELNRQRVLKRWRKIHQTEKEFLARNMHIVLPLKARLHGYLCGDGSVSNRVEKGTNRIHYDIRFYPDHRSIIKPFIEALEKVYNKSATIRREKGHYRIFLTSKTVGMDLLKDSAFGSDKWDIPSWIQQNEEYLKEWLRAFFDAEACVMQREIRVQTVNLEGAYLVQKCLSKLGVSARLYRYKRKQRKWKDNIHIVIANIKNRKRFLNKIGFNHVQKLEKLKSSLCQDGGIRNRASLEN